jgi:hypothetical protein
MPKSAKDFLTVLLTKAGVKIDDEAIQTALGSTELATIQIPDELITPIDNGLLSVSAAKNNHTEIKNFYYKAFADNIDKHLLRHIEENKLPDEIKEAVLGADSTYNRITALATKIREAEAAKAGAGKADKDTLQQEITRLQGELRAEKEKQAGVLTEHQKAISEVKMGYSLGQLLGGFKTIYDELPPDVKDITLKAIINKNLAADAAEFSVDDSGQLVLRKKDGTNFFGEDHRPFTPNTYLEKMMARDKILKVTDPNQNNAGNGAATRTNNGQTFQRQQNQNQNNSGNNGNGKAANPVLASLAQDALKALESNGV